MTWEKVTLGDVCTVTSSKRFHLSERTDKGIPFYCSKEIIQKIKGEEITECDYIDEGLYKNISEKYGVPTANDLLVTTRGTIGIPYIYKENDKFYFADGNLTWIKDFEKRINSRWLYFWFLSHEGQKKIDAIAKGTAQKAVPILGIKQLEILLPPLDTQCKIVSILSAYDDLIENNKKQIKLLEEAAQRLYKEWFVDLRFPGHENTKIVDGVPEGWKVDAISSRINLQCGFSFKSNEFSESGAYKIITIKNVKDGCFENINMSRIENIPDKMPSYCNIIDGDILLSLTGNVGRVCIAYGENLLLNQRIAKIKSDFPAYSYCLFRSEKMFYEMNSLANGAAQQNLSPIRTGNLMIAFPPRDILQHFEGVAFPLLLRMTALNKTNSALVDARDILLPKLMSGEIEV